MSRIPETPPGAPPANIYEEATLKPHASAPESVTGRPPARVAAHTPPKSQSQLADEKRAEAQRSRPLPPQQPASPPPTDPPPTDPAVSDPTARLEAKKREDRTPYDPAKAARERNKQQEATARPPMTVQQHIAAKRPLLRPEKKKLLRDED